MGVQSRPPVLYPAGVIDALLAGCRWLDHRLRGCQGKRRQPGVEPRSIGRDAAPDRCEVLVANQPTRTSGHSLILIRRRWAYCPGWHSRRPARGCRHGTTPAPHVPSPQAVRVVPPGHRASRTGYRPSTARPEYPRDPRDHCHPRCGTARHGAMLGTKQARVE